ncbi:unnamed protein product, partial [Dibothriocephalus latus]
MFVNKNIWALVEQEPEAFRPSQLHDVTFVINAFDFLHTVLRDQKISYIYGGEYSELAVKFDEILRNFLRCNLRPIFVFGGIVKNDAEPKSSRLLHLRKQVMFMEKYVESEITGSGSSYFSSIPVFTKETLVGVLNNLNIKHVTCDTETLAACVSLAAYLRCPVVADGADILLYEFEDPIGCDYAALADHFPPTCEQFPLPQGAPHPPPRSQGSAMAAEEAKSHIDSLITWLSQVSSPLDVFEKTVSILLKDRATLFIQRAFYIARLLSLDFDQGHQLASFLQLSTSPTDALRVRTSVDLISWLNNRRDSLLPKFNWLFAVLDAELEASSEIKRFLASVPANFLHFYRSGLVSPVMVARLFSGDWIIHPLVEDAAQSSVTDCSAGLRFLQYCLNLGFAVQCGHFTLEDAATKIVSETSRAVSGSLKTESMRLSPFFLPLSSSAIQQHDDRLRSLANSLESDGASKAALGTLSIKTVHDINQMQLIYMSLLSLVRMMDLINFTNGSAAFGNKSATKA